MFSYNTEVTSATLNLIKIIKYMGEVQLQML